MKLFFSRKETKFSATFQLPEWHPKVLKESSIVTSCRKSPIKFYLPRLIFFEGKETRRAKKDGKRAKKEKKKQKWGER